MDQLSQLREPVLFRQHPGRDSKNRLDRTGRVAVSWDRGWRKEIGLCEAGSRAEKSFPELRAGYFFRHVTQQTGRVMETGSIKTLVDLELPVCQACGEKPVWCSITDETDQVRKIQLRCQRCVGEITSYYKYFERKDVRIFRCMIDHWKWDGPKRVKDWKFRQIEKLFGRV